MDFSERDNLFEQTYSINRRNKLFSTILKIAVVALGLVGSAVVIAQLSVNRKSDTKLNGLLGIVGGQDARPGEFPWQISLQIIVGPTTRSVTCGGTLIDATHVITAAHCGAGERTRDLEVVAGAYKIKNTAEFSQQRMKISRLIRHPDFDIQRVKNDVAVIILEEPVKFNDYVQPLRLPPKNMDLTGQVCVTTGWGKTNPSDSEPTIIPNELQAVNLTIISNTFCSLAFGSNVVDDSKLCVHDFNGGKSPCSGDSGGPLVCYDSDGPFLAGITSFGPETCGIKEGPSVFTRVESMLEFISTYTQVQEDFLII